MFVISITSWDLHLVYFIGKLGHASDANPIQQELALGDFDFLAFKRNWTPENYFRSTVSYSFPLPTSR